jgi:L-lactate dehydrogenase complex protein LldF
MPEKSMMQLWAWAFSHPSIYLLASRLARWGQFVLARSGWIRKVPVYPASQWTAWRDVPALPKKSFHDRWKEISK